MADRNSADGTTAGTPPAGDAPGALVPESQPHGQQRQSQPTGSASAANRDGEQGSVREGASERGGEGGYGNDTGFATGTEAPRDADAAGRSRREQQTSDTYGDAGQGSGDEGRR